VHSSSRSLLVILAQSSQLQVSETYPEGFVEYYDMKKDYWQLHNAKDELAVQPVLLGKIKARLEELRACVGPSCHTNLH